MKKYLLVLVLSCITIGIQAQNYRLADLGTFINGNDWLRIHNNINVAPFDFFSEYQSHLGFNNKYSFQLFKQFDDELGFEHFRFNQYYKGVRVEGAQYILHSLNSRVVKANGKLVENISSSTVPGISTEEAIDLCKEYVNAPKYYWEDPAKEQFIKVLKNDPGATFYPQPELVLADEEYRKDGANYSLCWKVEIFAEGPIENEIIFVDAQNGSILYTLDGCVTGSATAVTRYSGSQSICTSVDSATFVLLDSTRGGGIFTYDMNNSVDIIDAVNFEDSDDFWDNANTEADDAATDAHWGMEMTYDYFLQKHNRLSFDDNNSAIISYIHHDNNWFNAQWFGRMYARFGDGAGNPLTSIDVTAHELTHGVTQQTSDLIYRNESGALNESFSDIFGCAIENFALNDTGNWTMGAADFVLRNIQNPKAFSDPDTYHGQHWNFTSSDNGGVHTNSGVQNYWYYLLTVGDTGTNDNGDYYDVIGLGRDTAEAIAYRNNFAYLGPNSTYFDARQGAIEAAEDLYGSCSYAVMQTNNAWYAVGVGPDTLTKDLHVLSAMHPVESCDLSSSEMLGIIYKFNESGCSNAIAAGDTISAGYRLNGGAAVVEPIILSSPLNGGDTIVYSFITPADLSAAITHEIDFFVNYAGDDFVENDTLFGIEVRHPLVLSNTDFLSFEKRIQVVDSFYIKTAENSEVLVQHRAAAPGSNWGLQLAGNNSDTASIIIPTNQADNFILNPEYSCSACFCVDASTWTNVRMVFDLKQTFSLLYDSAGLGNISQFVSSARLMVNGTQIGTQYHPTSNDTDRFVTYIIDLDAYAGGPFEACFEGKHFIPWNEETIGGSTGDHTFIDNLYFTDVVNIGIVENGLHSFNLYPNPGNGIFYIKLVENVNSTIMIEVADVTGRRLLRKEMNGVGSDYYLDLSNYAKGLYLISVWIDEVKSTQRLIIE